MCHPSSHTYIAQPTPSIHTHRYSVCLAKDTPCTRQETSRQAIQEFDENSTCDHRICQRCSGTLTCDSMPPSRPQRDKRLTSACCPLISLRIETQWTSLNARVLWPVLSKGAGHHSHSWIVVSLHTMVSALAAILSFPLVRIHSDVAARLISKCGADAFLRCGSCW